jgi:hypothetical protein
MWRLGLLPEHLPTYFDYWLLRDETCWVTGCEGLVVNRRSLPFLDRE